MRSAPLTVIQGGITRLRVKGGARADSLYDLLNGYVTQAQTVRGRGGTYRIGDLSGFQTAGLTAYNGNLVVFSTSIQAVPFPFKNYVLQNPVNPALTLSVIHFAQPFLGFLYVVAQFVDGSIFHYWLRDSGVWLANTVYKIGDIVRPATNDQGIAFQANRISAPNPTWKPSTQEAANNVVEPTVYDGYYFTATSVSGADPHTGVTEPAWNASPGATTIENADQLLPGAPTVTPNPTNTVPSAIAKRYANPANPP